MHDSDKVKKDPINELQNLRQEIRELQNSNDKSSAELKLTKESLKETQNKNQQLQMALDKVESCVYMKDLQSRYIYANSKTRKLFNCSSEDVIGRGDEDFFSLETVKKLRSLDLQIFAGEQTNEEVDTTDHNNDRKVYLELKAPLYSDSEQGAVCGLLGISTDLTERKWKEEESEKNYDLLRIAGEKFKMGGWVADLEENRVYWSKEVAAIHEMPADFSPHIEEVTHFYAPEWRDKMTEVFANCARKGMSFDEQMQIITANGKRLWVRTIGEAVRDKTGKIVKVQGAFQDISERKWIENQLKERIKELNSFFRMSEIIEKEDVTLEEFYQKVVNIIPDSMKFPENTYARIEINMQEFCTESFTDTPWKLSVPIKMKNNKAGRFEVGYLEDLSEGGENLFLKEERQLISAFAERIGHITERKKTIQALQDSEELLAHTQEIAKVGSWRIDFDSNRLTWSDEICRIHGCHPQEIPVTSDTVLEFVHPEDRETVNTAYVNSMKDGIDTFSIQHRIIQKNTGLIRHIYGKGIHHRNNEGEIYRTVGMVQDITESVEKDRQIRQSLLEKETLLSEIHHRVKNNMAVIYSLVDLQQEFDIHKKDPASILKETKSRIRSMALVHEMVYENESITDLDVSKLMQKLIENIENIYKKVNQDIIIKLDVKDVYLHLNMTVPLCLLANELISNAFKHAFSDQESGEIAICFHKKKKGYQFVVKDTGCRVTNIDKITK